ncbi:MAG: hypothetical protein Q7S40_19500 [Opitutaceae bacterium]|nr:hypothetical protein [Opitutaceae bacterium]
MLVVVLVLSNIGLGIFGFFLLRAVDRRYSELIGNSIPVLSDLQMLTAKAVEAMRSTGPDLLDATAAHRGGAVARAQLALGADRTTRQELSTAPWMSRRGEARADFLPAGEAFTRIATEIVGLTSANKIGPAAERRERELRPAYDRYLAATTKVADVLEAESLSANKDFSARTGSLSTVMLGLGSWPVVILVGLLLLTAIFVVVLMVLFRGREMSDMP